MKAEFKPVVFSRDDSCRMSHFGLLEMAMTEAGTQRELFPSSQVPEVQDSQCAEDL